MKTIAEVAGFLGVAPRQTAKAVFYESDAEGRLVIALIRGDLEVNEAKVARLIQMTPVPASEDAILAVGAVPGFATGMGLDRGRCRILVDHSVAESNNLVCGANEIDYHFRHFNLDRDLPGVDPVDIAVMPDGAGCPVCEGAIHLRPGIGLATVAQRGVVRADPKMTFTDAEGKAQAPFMGTSRMPLERVMAAVIEAHHDQYGPRWPLSIAPWQVQLHALKRSRPPVRDAAEALYEELLSAGLEVLYDDRDESPGVQFAEADLLGIPIRLIVSERNFANDAVEFKRRDTGEAGVLPRRGVVSTVAGWTR
jgi:prolyl-tRNA synthetase